MLQMKERILTGWTITRVLYLAIGGFVFIQSVVTKEWFGAGIGVYFAAMGLFAFGCAGGNCFGGNCATETAKKTDTSLTTAKFEEIK